ncbi:NAD-dependent epimerase/dehydratase family protein [Microvirga sp. P5_D2]
MKILVTGANGLIGSEAVRYFDAQGHEVVGIDNNMRAEFFGPAGDTTWCRDRLLAETSAFRCLNLDIRDRQAVSELFRQERFDGIFHCAAQPSHDKAREIPFVDFEVNAVGTLNLLEANRQHSAESPFVFMSTNKVYGDAPNELELVELEKRWDYASPAFAMGIPEHFRIDQSTHSLFGASKLSADIMVQEYGRYFGIPTCCLRGGCLTGPNHSGVELHGFLSYLVKCNLENKKYTIFGYQGKQVRDNIHSADVVRFVDNFFRQPRVAAVYNIGGGKDNSVSMLEAFELVQSTTGKPMNSSYSDQHRQGDHICYYSDLSRIRQDYPDWNITKSVQTCVEEIVEGWMPRLAKTG